MSTQSLSNAVEDFRRARNQADLKEILSRLTGESTQLLSYDEVRQSLKIQGIVERGLQEIPVDHIVGSVGRYTDFTRDFLPKSGVNETRWARVKNLAEDMAGLPPIDVYKIGEVYFVQDGNHRVSVARSIGSPTIQARVTEVRTRVAITPDLKPDDMILKAEYDDFLDRTHLDELRPDANLEVTVPGPYPILLDHINVHRYFMGLDQQRDIPYDEAVAHWYDTVYLPVVQNIHDQGILQSYPNRTETDLYVWIAKHRADIEKDLGWMVPTDAAVSDLAHQPRSGPEKIVARISEKLLSSFSLDKLVETGPPPGEWRRKKIAAGQQLADRRPDRLFNEILVPISGSEPGWKALEQAILVAQREGARLHGLHVLPTQEETEGEPAQAVRQQFNQRCAEAGVPGELVLAVGEVARQVCMRARWADVIMPSLTYPPGRQPLERLSSGFRELIQRCPRPLFAIPEVTQLSRALLAYDGSPKAQEALFLATYLAGQWNIPLHVLTLVENGSVGNLTLEHARQYVEEHGVTAEFRLEQGPVADTILQVAADTEVDFLIMGGYGGMPVMEVVLGSVVDHVLRQWCKPILICR